MDAMKRRIFTGISPPPDTYLEEIIRKVSALDGVRGAHWNSKDSALVVEYDLVKIRMKDIEAFLSMKGFRMRTGALNKVKTTIIHFTEENERSNLSSRPSDCCANPTLPSKHQL